MNTTVASDASIDAIQEKENGCCGGDGRQVDIHGQPLSSMSDFSATIDSELVNVSSDGLADMVVSRPVDASIDDPFK
jgi:hypothetical protein